MPKSWGTRSSKLVPSTRVMITALAMMSFKMQQHSGTSKTNVKLISFASLGSWAGGPAAKARSTELMQKQVVVLVVVVDVLVLVDVPVLVEVVVLVDVEVVVVGGAGAAGAGGVVVVCGA